MSAVAKGAAGVGIPAVGIGGTYLYLNNAGDDSIFGSMPGWVFPSNLSEDSYFRSYAPYLISYNISSNSVWWKWSYENRFKKADTNSLSSDFQGTNDLITFQEKCGVAYTKGTSDLDPISSGSDSERFINDVWRFCSIFDSKPRTIDENNSDGKEDKRLLEAIDGYKGKIGENKKGELVSVTDTGLDNKRFWNVREKWFFSVDSQVLGRYIKSSGEKDTLFDDFYRKREKSTLKDKCAEAYKKTNETQNPVVKEEDVVKYCGLKIS